jgi:hypothetical protein
VFSEKLSSELDGEASKVEIGSVCAGVDRKSAELEANLTRCAVELSWFCGEAGGEDSFDTVRLV